MRSCVIGSLLWLLWSSTASALNNVISISKSCYIPGEGLVVSFNDATPQVRDWIGIIKATDNPNVPGVNYIQYVYTCGTFNCTGAAPASGSVSIFNGLARGQYKAVLLRSNTFSPLAVTSNFFVNTTCARPSGPKPTTNTITVRKSCYTRGEGVLATFTATNAMVRDRVGLIQASANVNGPSIFYPAVIFTCGSFSCSFAVDRGSVSVFNSLPPGRYKAVLLRGDQLNALAVSPAFNIANVCGIPIPSTKPPTRAPVRPSPPVQRSVVSVARSCYKSRQAIAVTFLDVGAQPGDRIGLVNATFNVNSNSKYYPSVIFTCGTFNCTTAPRTGTVNIYQSFAPGRYKAVLLRGKQLIALAVSANFAIATSCPGPAPTPVPGHSVSVDKQCYLSGRGLIVTFTNSDAKVGDRIGLVSANVDVEVNPNGYPSVIFTCGTNSCIGQPTSGRVTIYQRFANGKYKAVLLRGTQLFPLAVSQNFTVASSCV